jgi:tetratricopeptide (TPR) repeat protein
MKNLKRILFVLMPLLSAFSVEPAFAHASLNELIEYTTDLVGSKPGNPRALLRRARLHLRQGNASHALKDIEAAERFSDHIEVAYILGLYFVAEDQHQEAIHSFSQYLTRFPVFTPAIHGRAKAYAKLELIDLSIRDYQYLLSVSKEHSPDYYLELARLESTLEPYGIHLALKSLDRGIESLGLLVSLQTEAIKFELLRKDYSAALVRHETLEQWLGKTPQWQMRKKQLSDRSLVGLDLPNFNN